MQQDNSECLMMPVEVINKGSVPYCGSNDNNSIWVSLSDILFSFMFERYIVCDVRGLRSPSFEYSSALFGKTWGWEFDYSQRAGTSSPDH